MSFVFKERSREPERMDLEPLDAAATTRILTALERVNEWLGGVQATLARLRRFSHRWQPGERLRFIDWGTGGADMPRAIVRWCRRKGFRAEILGIDVNEAVLTYARQACRDYPEITLVHSDLNTFIPSGEPFDYALSSLCLHHLSDPEIVALLKRSDRLTRRGLIMNDLERSGRAWAWIWTLTRLLRAHPIVQNDGPLSVKRAFTRAELEGFAREAGLSYVKVETHFGYRLTLAGEKNDRHT
ncbi:MAG: methyltransferase domain-containing protein [Elusimicrobiota bacterium]|jgi:ubiquinone/menaquinone biosynthesis C-methylase UbiE